MLLKCCLQQLARPKVTQLALPRSEHLFSGGAKRLVRAMTVGIGDLLLINSITRNTVPNPCSM